MSSKFPPVKVGVIGCGKISAAYFEGCALFDSVEVVACADLFTEAAKAKAAEFNIPRVLSVDELLTDPEIEIVVNLTIPQAHAAVNQQALENGKHAYCEKPFGLHMAEGLAVQKLAREKGLLVGCAPDTFLGAGQQTARRIFDQGIVGDITGGVAFMVGRGPEHWHPNPEFYYKVGGGPLFDMGPYYITALVNLLGPAKRVTASHKTAFTQRTIGSEPFKGKVIEVETPTHLTGIIEFQSGALITTVFSFDAMGESKLPFIQLYGTKGTLHVPNPNNFDGEVSYKVKDQPDSSIASSEHSAAYGRGTGVADMAYAVRTGRPFRANGDVALHVLEVMESFIRSGDEGKSINLQTTCVRPEAIPAGLPSGTLD